MDTEISQHRKFTLEKKISCCFCGESNPGPFTHKSSAVTTELSLLPSAFSTYECWSDWLVSKRSNNINVFLDSTKS